MNLKVLVKILGLFCAGMATVAVAASEYQSTEPYGNAQTPCFRGSMSGGSTHLSLEEEARLLDSLPIKEEKHFYGRMSVNSGAIRLGRISNVSPSTPVFYSATHLRDNQTALEFGFGYFWSKNTRLELEFLANKSFIFDLPVSKTSTGSFSSTWNNQIKNNTLLLNSYYETMFGGYDRFHPFATVGAGFALNNVQTSLIGSSASNKKRKGVFAFSVGAGFRFVIFSRVSLVASIRYINFGKVILTPGPQSGFVGQLKGRYSRAPVSLGLLYLF